MEDWREYKLKDFAHVNPRESIPKGTLAKKVPMESVEPFTKKIFDFEEVAYKGGVKFRNGDTIMARITPSLENGKTAFVDILEKDEVGYGSTEFVVFREKEDVSDAQYIYYFTISPEFRDTAIKSMTGTSGRQRVQIGVVKDFEGLFPRLPEQRAIASVLSSLDDKIDLLHRQNQTLEEMAETLFRQWFVEEADEDWEDGKLEEEFDFTMGLSPPGKSYNEENEGVPMYQGNADFGFRFPSNRIFTTDPKRYAEKFDTLISVRAPVGAQNMANEKCCIGRGVAAFRYKKDNSFYSYTYYKLKSLMDEIKLFNQTGTVFGSITKKDFQNMDVIIPDNTKIKEFQNKVDPIDSKIFENSKQIQTLTQLRDTLLPKLMSGEMRIHNNN